MSQTTNEGGSTYTKCEIALPSIDSGTAIVSDQSKHTGASGTQLPPTQIRLVFKNPKKNQKNNAENLEDANKKKRRLKSRSDLLLNDFIGGRKVTHAASMSAPPGPFNAHLFTAENEQQSDTPTRSMNSMNSMNSMKSISATNKNNPHTFNMREIRKLSEPDSSESSISETDEGGRTITLEVGQTLFEPATHPGFLEGKELIAGKLVSQCGPEV